MNEPTLLEIITSLVRTKCDGPLGQYRGESVPCVYHVIVDGVEYTYAPKSGEVINMATLENAQ